MKVHNNYRRNHGVGPLQLDPALNKYAQNWAKQLAKKGTLQYSGGNKGKYG